MTSFSQSLHGIWRLSRADEWQSLNAADTSTGLLSADVLEMVAALCVEQLDVDAEVVILLEEQVIMCVAHGEDRIIATAPAEMNRMLLRTAMRRAARGQRVPSIALSRAIEQTAEPARRVDTNRQDAPDARGSGSPTSDSTPSGDHGTGSLPSPRIVVEPAQEPVSPSQPYRRSETGDLSDLVQEVVILDDALAASPTETPTPTRESSLAEASPDTTWQDAADWIAETIDMAAGFVGATVASNYWRTALTEVALHGNCLVVDFRGGIESPEPERTIASDERFALDQAYAGWMDRCRAVIPAFDELVGGLPAPPWSAPAGQPPGARTHHGDSQRARAGRSET